MPETFTAQRQALGDAYLGDTKAAKALFSDPTTFDQRVISLLSGLGQGVDSPLPSSISGQDIREVLAAFDSTDNAKRVSIISALSSFSLLPPLRGIVSLPYPMPSFSSVQISITHDGIHYAKSVTPTSLSVSYLLNPIRGNNSDFLSGEVNFRLTLPDGSMSFPAYSAVVQPNLIEVAIPYGAFDGALDSGVISAINRGFSRGVGGKTPVGLAIESPSDPYIDMYSNSQAAGFLEILGNDTHYYGLRVRARLLNYSVSASTYSFPKYINISLGILKHW